MAMPNLSPTMETGKIIKWHVKVGDEVAPGDLLADVETDKSTMGWEIQDDGVIARLLVPEGDVDIATGAGCLVLVDDATGIEAVTNMTFDDMAKSAPADESPVTDAAEPKQPAPEQKADSETKAPFRADIKILEETWMETSFLFKGQTHHISKEALAFVVKNKLEMEPLIYQGNHFFG
jgi:pyruvate/2-oxoglutarate dehydrogenase complex dihydrolipoamide acyltransferase (E2) component